MFSQVSFRLLREPFHVIEFAARNCLLNCYSIRWDSHDSLFSAFQLFVFMLEFGNFNLERFKSCADVAIFGQMLLGLLGKLLHLIQLSASDTAMNSDTIKRNNRTFWFSHRRPAFLYFSTVLSSSGTEQSQYNAARIYRN